MSPTVIDRLVLSTAETLSRRRVLRRAGDAIAATALAATLFDLSAKSAFAAGSCSTHPCGPSPVCTYRTACGNVSNCGGCRGRIDNTYTCQAGNTGGCWPESCSSGVWQGNWSCCDCSCPTGGNTTSCGGQACICRYAV